MRRQPPNGSKPRKAIYHMCDKSGDCHSDHFQKKLQDNATLRYVIFNV